MFEMLPHHTKLRKLVFNIHDVEIDPLLLTLAAKHRVEKLVKKSTDLDAPQWNYSMTILPFVLRVSFDAILEDNLTLFERIDSHA